MLTTGYQLKAARSLIGMEQSELAEKAGLNVNTIRNMESACGSPIAGRAANVQTIQRTLEAAGIEFLNHGQPGVRMRKTTGDVHADLSAKIDALHENLPVVDEKAKPSPKKAMAQLEHARVKNEIQKATSKKAKLAPKK